MEAKVKTDAYSQTSDGYDARAEEIVAEMTTSEKIGLLHGRISMYTGKVLGVERLGVPPLYMNDGPQGFRGPPGTSVAWPCSLAFASTWDTNLVFRWSQELAKEFREKGASIVLGPGLNIARVPVNGRNFEYLSGESPALGAAFAKASITGIQSIPGIMATAKHFIANSQETNRFFVSSEIDDDVLHEMYLPAFAAAVQSGVYAVMCSYNKIHGTYACENNSTLGILREELGFEGIIMSDWFATHSTLSAARHGLDIEMPLGLFFGVPLALDVELGVLDIDVVDSKAKRIVRNILKAGIEKDKVGSTIFEKTNTPQRVKLARDAAAASTILLRNMAHLLPITNVSKIKKLLVVGEAAKSSMISSGGGSGTVIPSHCTTILEGIQKYFSTAGIATDVVEYDSGIDISETIKKAWEATYVVVALATSSSEGFDRSTLSFGKHADNLVSRLAKSRQDIIVVTVSPGAVVLPWSEEVGAILSMFLPGQEAGNGLADVLFGVVNPSARLPLTFPNKDNEVNFTRQQYPGVNLKSTYTEGMLVGYRWYDYHSVEPKYPFGHGLSYTEFVYSSSATQNQVKVTITNAGNIKGAEVVQAYIDKSILSTASRIRPVKELVRWKRVLLAPGEKRTVVFTFGTDDAKIWCVQRKKWHLPKSHFKVMIGASSRDIREEVYVDIPLE